MLTGRSPYATKTFFRHTPLRVEDADRHLPAMLNQMGYSGVRIADRIYANSVKQNMRNSFAETYFVNVSWIPSGLYHDVLFDLRIVERLLLPVRVLIGDGYQLIGKLLRSKARAAAPSDAREVAKATKPVRPVKGTALGDQARVDLLLRRLETLPEPYYVHLHLGESHISTTAPDEEIDAAIEVGDGYFRQILSWLERRGKLKDSLIVISSDHSHRRNLYDRIPLMIHFPNEEYTGVVDGNVQLLDLAPTLLRYLGQPIPDWMDGQSLLPPESIRLDRDVFGFFDRPLRVKPPNVESATEGEYFAPLGVVSLIHCGQWFYYSIVEARILDSGSVDSDRPSCPNFDPRSEGDARILIERYLEERDVSPDDMPPTFTKML